jgi:hypothetical protein
MLLLYFFLAVQHFYSLNMSQNPFYELEMPVRCDLFNINLEKLIERYTVPGSTNANFEG